ncbi:MAG: aminotransferase class V-fold PLP-dependent enzyme, partial [Planctomycetota bacterium]
MRPVYLDNAATTPVAQEVRAALAAFLEDEFGNPSSRHALGVRAAEAVDAARARIARATGGRSQNVVFTSGGTESNNLAVLGAARARKRGNVVIGPTEHPSVRGAAEALTREGFELRVARLGAGGELDIDSYAELLDQDTVVVSQMLVNGEFGTLYPVSAVARLVRQQAPRAHLHVDAVQGLGKVELDLAQLGADS